MKYNTVRNILLLVIALLLFCAGCGNSNNSTAGNHGGNTEIPVPKETLAATPARAVEYEFDEENGGIMITRYACNEKDVILPASIDGQKVVSIGPEAMNNGYYTSIVIQEGVTYIHRRAFANCEDLTKVSLPSTLKVIDAGAFYICVNLSEINFPDGLYEIGESAFFSCYGLTDVTLPDSTEYIFINAFDNCPGIETVTYRGKVYQYAEFADEVYCRGHHG